jgi:hypothetical protein
VRSLRPSYVWRVRPLRLHSCRMQQCHTTVSGVYTLCVLGCSASVLSQPAVCWAAAPAFCPNQQCIGLQRQRFVPTSRVLGCNASVLSQPAVFWAATPAFCPNQQVKQSVPVSSEGCNMWALADSLKGWPQGPWLVCPAVTQAMSANVSRLHVLLLTVMLTASSVGVWLSFSSVFACVAGAIMYAHQHQDGLGCSAALGCTLGHIQSTLTCLCCGL